ncbi:hypothetical protein AKJ09_06323 [Labilithrix luteola]|uniref:Uncharacterized protein n=1 Tax=Labilithrix luteola TaxID=1391654 RepID=A0A0K1Q2P6_9BACT|nr:hypothetical protein AKJ09_06323 [Labilithrix luteola]
MLALIAIVAAAAPRISSSVCAQDLTDSEVRPTVRSDRQ